MHIVDNARNPQRCQLRAWIIARAKALLCRMPRRLRRLNQLALHLQGVADFAAELISYAIEKISGSVIVSDQIALLRALDTTEHRGHVIRAFRSLPG